MDMRITAVLLVVLAILGGYVLWSGSSTEEAGSPGAPGSAGTAETEVPVAPFDPAAARSIRVVDAAGAIMSVERTDAGWQIAEPLPGPADTIRVTGVLTDLAELTATQVITPDDGDLLPYGLLAALYTITVTGDEGELVSLRLGTPNPGGTATYVQANEGDVVYLVSDFRLSDVRRWVLEPPVAPTPTIPPPPLPTLAPTPAPTPTVGADN